MTSTSIKKIKVNDLIPYANNSRTHSDEQVLQIASSIKEFGFCLLYSLGFSYNYYS